jgi:hypothetical protein
MGCRRSIARHSLAVIFPAHAQLTHTPETVQGVAKENAVAFLFTQTGIKQINSREMC